MVTTTTLKLPDELKARVAAVAQAIGKTPHAIMIDALTMQMTLLECRQTFIESALNAEQGVADYGLFYEADEVFDYLQARVNGKSAKWPKPKKL